MRPGHFSNLAHGTLACLVHYLVRCVEYPSQDSCHELASIHWLSFNKKVMPHERPQGNRYRHRGIRKGIGYELCKLFARMATSSSWQHGARTS